MDFIHVREPYGTLHLTDCIVEHVGSGRFVSVTGTVKEGVTRSFMLGCSSARDETGTQHTVYDVSKVDLKQGYKRSIAM